MLSSHWRALDDITTFRSVRGNSVIPEDALLETHDLEWVHLLILELEW